MNGKRELQKRSWVSLLLALSSAGLLASGILSFGLPYSPALSGIHTWFGVAFILTFGFHFSNNLRSLVNYLKKQTAKKQLTTGFIAVACIFVGVFLDVAPFSSVLDFGSKLRKTPELDRHRFTTINTRVGKEGRPLSISLRAGPHCQSPPQPLFFGLTYRPTPQVAFWIEDEEGNYLQSLYVTGKIAESGFRSTDLTDSELKRRPEALPYWAHKRGVLEADGLLVPRDNTKDLDGITGATPQGHYDISTRLAADQLRFRLMMEINRSYDFNHYYSHDRFPDDPIYSGSGASGQTSVVYSALMDATSSKPVTLQPIGHGHHSGRDGLLYADMSGIDTALQLVDFVVSYLPADSGKN
jgi:hypothetical protein